MGCNGSKSVAAVIGDGEGAAPEDAASNDGQTRPVTPQPPQHIPPSMAFDIPFDDKEGDDGIVKKHPPRRLQRLEEQQQHHAPVSIEELEEKQQEAETRRQQYLQLRAQSAKRKYAMRNNPHDTQDHELQEEQDEPKDAKHDNQSLK